MSFDSKISLLSSRLSLLISSFFGNIFGLPELINISFYRNCFFSTLVIFLDLFMIVLSSIIIPWIS